MLNSYTRRMIFILAVFGGSQLTLICQTGLVVSSGYTRPIDPQLYDIGKWTQGLEFKLAYNHRLCGYAQVGLRAGYTHMLDNSDDRHFEKFSMMHLLPQLRIQPFRKIVRFKVSGWLGITRVSHIGYWGFTHPQLMEAPRILWYQMQTGAEMSYTFYKGIGTYFSWWYLPPKVYDRLNRHMGWSIGIFMELNVSDK